MNVPRSLLNGLFEKLSRSLILTKLAVGQSQPIQRVYVARSLMMQRGENRQSLCDLPGVKQIECLLFRVSGRLKPASRRRFKTSHFES